MQAYEKAKRKQSYAISRSNNIKYLGALEAAILVSHKCTPAHRETVFVRERMDKRETLWEGPVEVFDIDGHEQAKTCYAWRGTDPRGKATVFTVLENEFVDSANRAVQVAIIMDVQPIKSSTSLNRLKNNLMDAHVILHQLQIKTEELDAAIQACEIRVKLRQNRKSEKQDGDLTN